MEIAMVFDGISIGGTERVGCDYIRLLHELGHNVTVINLNPQYNQMESELPDYVSVEHFRFSTDMCPERYAHLIKKYSFGKYLYPSASIVLGIANSVYRIAGKKNEFLRRKYDLAIAFSGHFADMTFVESKFVRSKAALAWIHGALYGYLLRSDGYYNLYKKIKNLIVLVDDAQLEALTLNNQKNFNIFKLYNPCFIKDKHVDEGIARELKRKYGDFLLMVSRFSYPHKDHYTVVDALDILHSKFGIKKHLLFIGDGPDEEKVKNYVKDKGELASYVHFLGARLDVQNFYSAAKILVHASIAFEGLPTVMIEALAFNLPMVVTDSKVGPREILGNNEYGLLTKVQDAEDMAENIKLLLCNEEIYRKYAGLSAIRFRDFEPETIKRRLKGILK